MKHAIYEATGMIAALIGAFLLVGVLIPLINPGMFSVRTGKIGMPVLYYLVATPVAVLILAAAWYFNRKAQRLKKEAEGLSNTPSDRTR